jgi:hypothetical protein
MKIAKGSLLILLYACLNSFTSCSVKYAPPKVETCIHNQDASAECADLRKPENEQSYERADLTNYICTNPGDKERLYNYCADLRDKLIKCENQPRN